MAIENRKLKAGAKLVAKYKGVEHTCEVVEGPEGKLLYQLANGSTYKSPSKSASVIMDGKAVNGWRFWSLATEDGDAGEGEATLEATAADAG